MASIKTRDDFWALIQKGNDAIENFEELSDWLLKELEESTNEDIFNYFRFYVQVMGESFKSDLLQASWLINGAPFEDQEEDEIWDDFDDFRAWLVALGKEAYTNALENPDTLADYIAEDWEPDMGCFYAEMQYVPLLAYASKNNADLDDVHDKFPDPDAEYDLQGEEIPEDEIPKQFPKLYQMTQNWQNSQLN